MYTFIHTAWNDAGKENFRWLLDHVQCCIAEASEARQVNESQTQGLLLTMGKLELQHRELQDSISKAMQMEEALEQTMIELARAKQSTVEVTFEKAVGGFSLYISNVCPQTTSSIDFNFHACSCNHCIACLQVLQQKERLEEQIKQMQNEVSLPCEIASCLLRARRVGQMHTYHGRIGLQMQDMKNEFERSLKCATDNKVQTASIEV